MFNCIVYLELVWLLALTIAGYALVTAALRAKVALQALERDCWSLQSGGLKGHFGDRTKSIDSDCCSVAARVQGLGALQAIGA